MLITQNHMLGHICFLDVSFNNDIPYFNILLHHVWYYISKSIENELSYINNIDTR